MTIDLEIQIASNIKTLPHPSQFREWISAVLSDKLHDAELTIRIVDKEESAELNRNYRKKFGPTNVLSFPANVDPKFDLTLLGDIVICAPIVEQQALDHNKELLAHWAHMVVHGALHLLGYDHIDDEDAKIMEEIETKILVQLGYAPPYGDICEYD